MNPFHSLISEAFEDAGDTEPPPCPLEKPVAHRMAPPPPRPKQPSSHEEEEVFQFSDVTPIVPGMTVRAKTTIHLAQGGVLHPGMTEKAHFLPETALTQRRNQASYKHVQKSHLPSQITSVQLSLLDEDTLLRMSALHVTNSYRLCVRNAFPNNGVNDVRLGAFEHGTACGTCGHDAQECPGHFGHMVLATPLVHPSYMKQCLSLLRVVCWACGAVRYWPPEPWPHDDDLALQSSIHDVPRLSFVAKSIPRTCSTCPSCDAPQPISYTAITTCRIQWAWGTRLEDNALPPDLLYEAKRPFTPARARQIFDALATEDLERLGFDPHVAHPRELILRLFPVPPISIRPSVVKIENSSMRGHDDLTRMLHGILKTNNAVVETSLGRSDAGPALCHGDLVLDECSATEVKRMCKTASLTSEKASEKARKDRRLRESVASMSTRRVKVKNEDKKAHTIGEILQEKGLLEEHEIDDLSLPFDESRIDSTIAMTRPFASPGLCRLGARPDVRLAEFHATHPSVSLEQLEQLITVYLDTDGKKQTVFKHKSGAPRSTIISRIKGKTGRFRANLMGKRVDASARSVVSPSPHVDLDQVGIPESMACILTIGPVYVNHINKKLLQESVRRGAVCVGGAHRVLKRDGRVIFLEYAVDRNEIAEDLAVGDQVERYIRDDDVVLFNRQPTLHMGGIMAHRVKVIPGIYTLLQNPGAAKPYNADYDGDEMNIHVPKGEQAQAEARSLLSIEQCLINPATNSLAVSMVQDAIVAGALFTERDRFLDRSTVYQILRAVKYNVERGETQVGQEEFVCIESALPSPAVLKPRMLWTGKQIFSMLLPKWLHVDVVQSGLRRGLSVQVSQRQTHTLQSVMDFEDRHVVIRDGTLLCGTLDKRFLGGSRSSIAHRIAMEGSLQQATRFISDVQRLLHEWFSRLGFTMKYHDCVLGSAVHRKIFRTMQHGACTVDAVAKYVVRAADDHGEAENRVRGMLARVMKSATTNGVAWLRDRNSTKKRNGLLDMVSTGSKGSEPNIHQLAVAVGIQIVGGKRIPINPQTGRTLPCYAHFSNTSESLGLIRQSYVDGLSPQSFFMHNIAGREGLVRTSIMTSDTGYLQRSLVKALEDLVVAADRGVYDSAGRMVQVTYGGDGYDPTRVSRVPAEFLACSTSVLRHKVKWFADEIQDPCTNRMVIVSEELCDAFCTRFIKLRHEYRQQITHPLANEIDRYLLLPINPEDIVHSVFSSTGSVTGSRDHPQWSTPRADNSSIRGLPRSGRAAIRVLEKIMKKHHTSQEWPPRRIEDIYDIIIKCMPAPRQAGLRLALLWALRPCRAMQLGSKRLVHIAAYIMGRDDWASIPAGYACGIIAAQSIGEPSTQLTLNSPHHSGRGVSRVTMGVPRLKEIIEGRKDGNIQTPCMIVPVRANTQAEAKRVATRLRRVDLSAVLRTSFIAEDPFLNESPWSCIQKDSPILEVVASVCGTEASCVESVDHLSRFVTRFALDIEKTKELDLTPAIMARCIERILPFKCTLVVSPVCMEPWVIRVRSACPEKLDRESAQRLHAYILTHASANHAHDISHAIPGTVSMVHQDPDTDTLVVQNHWVVQAFGSSLRTLAMVPEVDWTRIHTNDVTAVYEVLGIEAANTLIYDQLRNVMTNDGSYIDPRHLQLLADGITYLGFLMSVTRHGIMRKPSGWAHRASFEETNNVLVAGAIRAEVEPLKNPSATIMTGQRGSFGTGCVALFDEDISRTTDMAAAMNQSQSIAYQSRGLPPNARFIDGKSGMQQTRDVRQLERLSRRKRMEGKKAPQVIPMKQTRDRFHIGSQSAHAQFENTDARIQALPEPVDERTQIIHMGEPPVTSMAVSERHETHVDAILRDCLRFTMISHTGDLNTVLANEL